MMWYVCQSRSKTDPLRFSDPEKNLNFDRCFLIADFCRILLNFCKYDTMQRLQTPLKNLTKYLVKPGCTCAFFTRPRTTKKNLIIRS
jgi:hypothetical protein